MDALNFLKYGTVGLCAVLTYFAFQLLSKEQNTSAPRPEILRAIWIFMTFSVVSMCLGLASQLPVFRPQGVVPPTNQPSPISSPSASVPEADVKYLTANWQISDGHDDDFQGYRARFTYLGTLAGRVEGADLVLEGTVTTLENGKVAGAAQFTARGPIDKNEVAAHFTYRRVDVSGFGTAFIKFNSDGQGVMYLIARATRPVQGQGDVGLCTFYIERRS
jgi:hypothetical protein